MSESRRTRRSSVSTNPDRFNKSLQALSPTHHHNTRKKERMHNLASMLGTVQAVSKFKLRRGSVNPDVEFDEAEDESNNAEVDQGAEEDNPTEADQENSEGEEENVEDTVADDGDAAIGNIDDEQENTTEEQIDAAPEYDNPDDPGPSFDDEENTMDDTEGDSVQELLSGLGSDLGVLAKSAVSSTWTRGFNLTKRVVSGSWRALTFQNHESGPFHSIKASLGSIGSSTTRATQKYIVEPLSHDSLLDHIVLLGCLLGTVWLCILIFASGSQKGISSVECSWDGFPTAEQTKLIRSIVREEYQQALSAINQKGDEMDAQLKVLQTTWDMHQQELVKNIESEVEHQQNTQRVLKSVKLAIEESVTMISTSAQNKHAIGEEVLSAKQSIDRLGQIEQDVLKLIQNNKEEFDHLKTLRVQLEENFAKTPQQEDDSAKVLGVLSKQMESFSNEISSLHKESGMEIERVKEELMNLNTTKQLWETAIEKVSHAEDLLEGCVASQGEDSHDLSCDVDQVSTIVDEAVGTFAADRIGRPDFALAAVGTVVVHGEPFTSPSYSPETSSLFEAFHQLLHPISLPPETVIDPDTTIGSCWACHLPDCHVTVRFVRPITVGAVSIDHISPLVAHDIRSAPRAFRVYGLPDGDANKKVLLLESEYTVPSAGEVVAGNEVQTFDVSPSSVKFDHVQLQVVSNQGFPDYTCIYRFRVHSP